MLVLTIWSGFTTTGLGACWHIYFYVLLIGSYSDIVWRLTLGILVLWLIGRDSDSGQCQILPVTCPWIPDWSYKSIHNLWLPLLYLGRTRLCIWPVSKSHEPYRWSAKGPSNSPASYLLGWVTERTYGSRLVNWVRFLVRHKIWVSCVYQNQNWCAF